MAIYIPQEEQRQTVKKQGNKFGMGGALAGALGAGLIAATGGAAAPAVAGAALGGIGTGNLLGGFVDQATAKKESVVTREASKFQPNAVDTSAIQRRLDAVQTDPLQVMREGQMALRELPMQVQQELAPQFSVALAKLQQSRRK